MARFHKSTKVDASADKAWSVVRDLTAMGKLTGAANVRVEGMKRICTFSNGIVQHEEISDYSEKKRSYRYRIEGSPLPVRNNKGKFAIEASGKNSILVWDAEFEPLDPAQEPQVAKMWEGAMSQFLESLRQLIEKGK